MCSGVCHFPHRICRYCPQPDGPLSMALFFACWWVPSVSGFLCFIYFLLLSLSSVLMTLLGFHFQPYFPHDNTWLFRRIFPFFIFFLWIYLLYWWLSSAGWFAGSARCRSRWCLYFHPAWLLTVWPVDLPVTLGTPAGCTAGRVDRLLHSAHIWWWCDVVGGALAGVALWGLPVLVRAAHWFGLSMYHVWLNIYENALLQRLDYVCLYRM